MYCFEDKGDEMCLVREVDKDLISSGYWEP